jgi:hypothetical protein
MRILGRLRQASFRFWLDGVELHLFKLKKKIKKVKKRLGCSRVFGWMGLSCIYLN